MTGAIGLVIITPGATCNLNVFTNTHFGVDTTDYFADPSLWQIGTRIYVGNSMTQWFVDVVVVESPQSCNAGLALVYVVATEAEVANEDETGEVSNI